MLFALLVTVQAKPGPGIEEHLAEAAEETFEVLDPPRMRDSSEQFHQAVESHNLTDKLTPTERHKVLVTKNILIYHKAKTGSTINSQDLSFESDQIQTSL